MRWGVIFVALTVGVIAAKLLDQLVPAKWSNTLTFVFIFATLFAMGGVRRGS